MLTDTPLTDAEEIVIYGDCDRYVSSGLARELERENKRLKQRLVELTEMLIEVRDNPNNNVFERFALGKMRCVNCDMSTSTVCGDCESADD